MQKLQVGDRVKLTGKFLKNTGQRTGGEGQSVWTVVECSCKLCARGEFVAVNETSFYGEGARHFNAANLYKKGTLTVRNDP